MQTHDDSKVTISLHVNGESRTDTIPARMLLVDYIREVVGLTGTHLGCDTSTCGACTVLLDGRSVKSCTLIAAQAHGHRFETIESLSLDGTLHPVQRSFWRHHALQCGFCTPGMVISAVQLLSENPRPTEVEVREAIAGNICRCTGYENIVRAIRDVHAEGSAPTRAEPVASEADR